MKCVNCGKELVAKNGKYCSVTCQLENQHKMWVEDWLKGNKSGLRGEDQTSKHIKRYIREKFGNKCCKCGWAEVNPYTGKVPLEIEHIDGDFRNNSEENLLLLCPNCHSLTATYKGANKGHGRNARRKYYVMKARKPTIEMVG